MTRASAERELLIRGGTVLTMDPQLGTVAADVLIDDGSITRIGADLQASDAATVIDATDCAVLPGLIDTHRHLWAAAVRHTGVGWDYGTYHMTVQRAWGEQFTPEDVYWSELLAAMAALNAGVTTVCDESHIQNSPAHTDAAVRALKDSGIRARFGYGWPSTNAKEWMFGSTRRLSEDIHRVRHELLPDDGSLITMQAMLRGPEMTGIDMATRDIAVARDLGLRSTMHIGTGWAPGIQQLSDAKLLGPDMVLIHATHSTDSELDAAVSAGAKFSAAPGTEAYMPGLGIPCTARVLHAGGLPGISADTDVASTADLFSTLRAALTADTTMRNALPAEAERLGEPLQPQDLLLSATSWGAEVCGLDSLVGSLTPGRAADVIVVRLDDLTMFPAADVPRSLVAAATAATVDTVIVNGKILKTQGRMVSTHFDLLRPHILELHNRLSPQPGSGPVTTPFS